MSSDRYEIKGKIGQGGVGAVYRAYDMQLNRDVAIKRVLPEGGFESEDDATEHLLKEATSLSSIQHPHIVTVYDSGVDDDGPYVVMELLDGRTIEEMVERSVLTIDDFKEVALQSQEALIAAQDLNLVHRDLKPSNVMVTWLPSGRFQVKIVDFGLAKFSPKPSLQTIDHGDSVFGSIFFMAPEQFERTELDQRTDMYAMGCVYYFCLTGHYPFDGETAAEVMEAHLNHEVKPVKEHRPDVPDWLNDWIMWHINRDLEHRPENARTSLESFLTNNQAWADTTAAAGAPMAAAVTPKLAFADGTSKSTTASTRVTARPTSTTSPQALAPPKGQQPSVHTTAQQAASAITSSHVTKPAISSPVGVTPGTAPVAANPASAPVSTQTAPQSRVAEMLAAAEANNNFTSPTMEKKKGLSAGAKIALVAALGGLIIIIAFFILNKLSANKKNDKINNLTTQAGNSVNSNVDVKSKDIKLLISSLASMTDQAQRDSLYNTLYKAKSMDGTDIDAAIREEAFNPNLKKPIRLKLFNQVLRARAAKSSFDPLTKFVINSNDPDLATAAMVATEKMAEEEDIDTLLSIIKSSSHSGVKKAAEKTALILINNTSPKGYLANQLEDAYKNASDLNNKYALIRLMGPIGGTKMKTILKNSLRSKEGRVSMAALTALESWPGDDAFQLMVDYLALTSDTATREKGFSSVLSFLQSKPDRSAQASTQMWDLLITEAISDQEKLTVIQGLGNTGKEWATPLLQKFSTASHSRAVQTRARKAMDFIKRSTANNN